VCSVIQSGVLEISRNLLYKNNNQCWLKYNYSRTIFHQRGKSQILLEKYDKVLIE
jgi:hypothetical protein